MNLIVCYNSVLNICYFFINYITLLLHVVFRRDVLFLYPEDTFFLKICVY